MIVKCKYCDKEFNIRPSAYKKSKTKIFYCCKEHMNKDRNIGKTKVKCTTCGKEFEKINSQIYKKNFCCKECLLAYKPKVKLTCVHCGKEFIIDESYYKKQSKRGQTPKYCSIDCRLAEQRKNKIKSKCKNCGKEIMITKDKNKSNFCSQECRIKYMQQETKTVVCNYCGKEFKKNKYAYDHAKTHYCSQKCYDEYRANKKETYKELTHYLRTHESYNDWRTEVLKKDNYKCTKCGSKKDLHAHHIIQLYDICEKYNMNKDKILNSKEFHDINNGITLCQDCHALEHPYISRDEKGRFISRSGPKSTEDPE